MHTEQYPSGVICDVEATFQAIVQQPLSSSSSIWEGGGRQMLSEWRGVGAALCALVSITPDLRDGSMTFVPCSMDCKLDDLIAFTDLQ